MRQCLTDDGLKNTWRIIDVFKALRRKFRGWKRAGGSAEEFGKPPKRLLGTDEYDDGNDTRFAGGVLTRSVRRWVDDEDEEEDDEEEAEEEDSDEGVEGEDEDEDADKDKADDEDEAEGQSNQAAEPALKRRKTEPNPTNE